MESSYWITLKYSATINWYWSRQIQACVLYFPSEGSTPCSAFIVVFSKALNKLPLATSLTCVQLYPMSSEKEKVPIRAIRLPACALYPIQCLNWNWSWKWNSEGKIRSKGLFIYSNKAVSVVCMKVPRSCSNLDDLKCEDFLLVFLSSVTVNDESLLSLGALKNSGEHFQHRHWSVSLCNSHIAACSLSDRFNTITSCYIFFAALYKSKVYRTRLSDITQCIPV